MSGAEKLKRFNRLLAENKRWWLVPIIIALLLIGAAVCILVSRAGTTPFVYSIF